MKKNMIRILALALVLILALGIIPLGALAADVYVPELYFNQVNPTLHNYFYGPNLQVGPNHEYNYGGTIKASDYDKYLLISGELYDFEGFSGGYATEYPIIEQINTYINSNNLDMSDPANLDKVNKMYEDLAKSATFSFSKKDIKVDPMPDPSKLTPEEYEKAFEAWAKKFLGLFAGYVPHQHKLSRWYSDGTTHWRECLVCKQLNPSHETMFMYQNWCQDGDEDQVCNVCGGHVPYHDITVIDSEGGKITLNRDNASHRMKITADVDVADGYTLHKLHFTKVRPDGSKQEVVRYGQGKSFWTNMPTYPMEVTAEYIKK